MNARMSIIIGVAASFLLVFCNQEIGFAEGYKVSRHEAENQRITVILQRVFLDGEVSEEIVTETDKPVSKILDKYDQWQLFDLKKDKLIFRDYVDDISPLLKANGYFGLTEEGILSIFNGKPQNSKIIQSFFQIDVGKLESRKKQQLKNGIPVKTKDRYQEVLETFKPYSKME
jgi:forespore regulator of the sigma-K checkpoint